MNNEYINVLFEPENFLHLTGFNKIKDSTIIALIDNELLGAKDFYDLISKGWLNYNLFNEDKILTPSLKVKADNHSFNYSTIKLIKDSDLKSVLRGVLINRVAFFNENTIMSVFGNKVVIDFDKNKCLSDINANKVFFKMFDNSDGHNINLFVKYEDRVNKGYPVTFFKEDTSGYFLKTRKKSIVTDMHGVEREEIIETGKANQYNVLVKIIIDKHTENIYDTFINWEKVRWVLRNEKEYETQVYLKENNYFKDNCITSLMLVEGISSIMSGITSNLQNIDRLEDELVLIDKFSVYKSTSDEDEKDTILEELMNQDLYIDDEATIERLLNRKKVEKSICEINKKVDKLTSTKDIYEERLTPLKQLELKEVKFIYSKFFDTSKPIWTDKFARQLIIDGCYNNRLTLNEIANRVGENP